MRKYEHHTDVSSRLSNPITTTVMVVCDDSFEEWSMEEFIKEVKKDGSPGWKLKMAHQCKDGTIFMEWVSDRGHTAAEYAIVIEDTKSE